MVRNNQILRSSAGLLLCFLVSLILQGCSGGTAPSKEEITGTWVNADGAVLVFKEDGTFTGKYLPAEVFISRKVEYIGQRFDCNGTWYIEIKNNLREQQPWYVGLNFEETTLSGSNSILTGGNVGFGKYVLISGSGLMENKPPWNYLFRWKDEEGGERYKFEKQ